MIVTPFQWKLSKLSAPTVAAVESLYSFLPNNGARDVVSTELRKVLMQHLGNDTYFFVEAVELMPCRQWLKGITDPAIVLVVGAVPCPHKILLQVDYVIAHHMIDRLMGGSGDVQPELRPLTDAEGGVLQYLCMQLLQQLHVCCQRDERAHFRFEKLLYRLDNIVPFVPAKADGVLMTLRLGFGEQTGYVRMLFSEPFVAEAMLTPLTPTVSESQHHLNRLAVLAGTKTVVWAEAGVVTITPEDLNGLEVGDVVLFDQTQLELRQKVPHGQVRLRIGEGQHGAIVADVAARRDGLSCTMTHVEEGDDYAQENR